MTSETKLDYSFHSNQSSINRYMTPFRLNQNHYGGGIIVDANEGVLCKFILMNDSSIGFYK